MYMHKMKCLISLPVCVDSNVMRYRANMPTKIYMSHTIIFKNQFPYMIMSAYKLGNILCQILVYLDCG